MNENQNQDGQDDVVDEDEDIVIDTDAVEALKFECLPKGDYDGVIAALDYSLSQSSNKPMWTVQIEIENNEKFAGKKLFTHISFSPAALPGSKVAIASFAPEVLGSNFRPKAVADSGDLLGKKVRIRVGIQMYNNEKRNKVARWLPVPNTNEFVQS